MKWNETERRMKCSSAGQNQEFEEGAYVDIWKEEKV